MGLRRFSISLNMDRDVDILAWIDDLPDRGRSEAVRGVLRGYVRAGGGQVASDGGLADRVADRILERLGGRVVLVADGADPGAEWTNVDPEILGNLKGIGG